MLIAAVAGCLGLLSACVADSPDYEPPNSAEPTGPVSTKGTAFHSAKAGFQPVESESDTTGGADGGTTQDAAGPGPGADVADTAGTDVPDLPDCGPVNDPCYQFCRMGIECPY
jgi:hypothetical protein